MATFKVCVQKHQKRTDGKYPVRISVIWKRERGWIKTEYYVTKKQLTDSFELKDPFIMRELLNRISKYEEMKVKKLGANINLYSAKDLAKYFYEKDELKNDVDIDFVEFANDKIKATENKGTAGIYQTVINSITDRFLKRDQVKAIEINGVFLHGYEQHLRDEGLTGSGINLYMRTLRALFYAMKDRFNDEDKGDIRISHNPFKKYKIPKADTPQKQALTIDQINLIRDIDKLINPREKQARDIFMLSFYLVGMNSADLYNIDDMKAGRIAYNRTKTQNRRDDKAFISIKVEPEAVSLIQKYKDKTGERLFNFHKQYADTRGFNKAINQGLKDISARINEGLEVKLLPVDLKFYAARHSWATIGRNDCGISKDDIHEALNHVDSDMKVTDGYIKKDWRVIDRANRRVLDFISQ